MAVYDDEKTKSDDLHAITGISPSEARDMEARAVAGADQDRAASDEKNLIGDDTVGKGFTGDKKKPLKGRISKKKASIIGVLTGGLIGGGLFGFSVIQGPMSLVHLGQVLQIFDRKSESDTNIRVTSWYRFWKSGEYGETRVSKWGSSLVNDRREKLSKMGIDFDGDRLGNLRSISFDTDKLGKERLAGLRDKSFEESKRILAQEFDLPEEDFRRVGTRGANGHRIVIVARGENITKIRNTVTKVASDPNSTGLKAKSYNALTMRAFKKFYNLPSLFSPLKKLEAKVDQKAGAAIDRKERKDREKERMERITAGAENANPGARKKLSEKLSGNTGKVIGGALITTSGMCFVRDIAEDVVEANRAAVVVPAVLDATDKIAVGSQIQSNIDMDMGSAGDVAEGLKDDDGKTIWQGTALQAINSNNFTYDPNKNDPNDLPPDYKQAFSNKTTSSDIKDTFGGGGVGDIACSTPGKIIQIAGGLGLIIAGPFTGGGSWAAFAAKTSASTAATAGVMFLIQEKLTSLLSADKIDVTSIPKPVRGSLLAHGALEKANTVSRSNGAIELSKQESDSIHKKTAQAQQAEFKNKKLVTQLFDMGDYRSIASQASMSLGPSVTQNISTMASGLMNFGNNLSTITSVFTPKTAADEKSMYSWEFNIFGIPDKILTDKKYEDPYKNADIITEILSVDFVKDKYTDKAKTCFGVTLSNESGQWDVTPENEVNPNSQKYIDAKCNDTSDELWVRIMLFVFDNRHMAAAACLELNDEDACNKIDPSYGITPQEDSSTTSTAGEKFDIALLDKDSDDVACAPNTKEIRNDDGYRGGKKIKVKLCEIPNLPQSSGFGSHNGHATTNSVVSGAVYAMVEAAKKDGVEMSAISTYRSMADQRSLCPCDGVRVGRPGYSNHQLGVAIDFGGNGQFMDTNNPMWKWLDKNADKFGYKPYSAEAWHWSPFGS